MPEDLFDFVHQQHNQKTAPLAFRMRPKTLDDFAGQDRVLGPGKPLRKWIENDLVPSLILWGPPGCGKTTLAKIIAVQTKSHFQSLSAVLAGVKDIKEMVAQARETKKLSGRKSILFVDEIHRFNKSQQDSLLPHVEDGTVTLIGATTENPSFEINAALLSRSRVIRLERLSIEALEKLILRALQDSELGLNSSLQLTPEALEYLAISADGDARRALTALESVWLYATGLSEISNNILDEKSVQAALESSMPRQPLLYDKAGEEHYNVISAFIKSIRDSDPHAGLYYLARMLEAGEDPLFIVRRLVVIASEDIGNAYPQALQMALAAKDAVDFIGMPEARIALGQIVTYLALAPKSNAAYKGINDAIAEVHASGALPVPFHIRNAPTQLMKTEGYGKGYRYAHDQLSERPKQTHLPEEILGKRFYQPKDIGFEKQMKEKLDLLNPDFDKKGNTSI